MIKLDGVVVENKALKQGREPEVYEYVKTIVREEELLQAKEKKIFKDGKRKIQNDHAIIIDVMTADQDLIHTSLGKDTEAFIKARQEVLDLQEEVKKCVPIQEVKKLSITDYVQILLMAHAIKRNIVLDQKLFELGKLDVINTIREASIDNIIKNKKVKDLLYSFFHKLIGSEGNYFYAVKVRRSDISDEDLKYLYMMFYKIEMKNYSTVLNNQRIKALTDFCSVIIGRLDIRKSIISERLMNKEVHYIEILDLVVRCNIFKCTHENHEIKDIDAIIPILGEDGKKQEISIIAGYCPQCNVYFIMNSVYENLKKKGILLCRVTDEKSYLKGGELNGMKLAPESLLMQYGYNVSQAEDLTATRRQKILAVIIDNKILSKNEIINYLDFFIHQHGKRNNMERAISKWEDDREFVEEYKSGEYTKYGVNAIYRR